MAFTPKTKEFTSTAGNDYTFQNVPNSKQAEIMDEGTGLHGKVLNSRMMPLMLKHVVVIPNELNMDDFETWEELEEVTNAAFNFLRTGK
ncbi:hypothetical protein LBYS11_12115 [Lysinibacillus sp. YS11]|uniref:hypothetical protein n=1 Tax=Lysinibacillus TaxID=400634 RepID=UPI00082657A1|nr:MULTISPECIES: hypothetical protein [Lysinibacillus]AUS87029.1 hypothetical protein LBYS11_12115 [Lysinibacillus sp. YS11]MED3873294.1 hypothetical protein [Lysinibacillus capsici]MED4551213.1 hypothetical protein [Lysinibacillus capsici]OCX62730.1 hypothetical protein BFM98_01670 [Lysinibacillus sp. AR18-8]